MSSDEFTTWQAYVELEQIGKDRDDWRFGMLASVIVNSNPWLKLRTPSSPRDFMPAPTQQQPRQTQTINEMRQSILAWNAAFGGVDHRKNI